MPILGVYRSQEFNGIPWKTWPAASRPSGYSESVARNGAKRRHSFLLSKDIQEAPFWFSNLRRFFFLRNKYRPILHKPGSNSVRGVEPLRIFSGLTQVPYALFRMNTGQRKIRELYRSRILFCPYSLLKEIVPKSFLDFSRIFW